ncbi:MAG TPA: hypothetical protein VMP68_31270 [Candidatus Eisenbacteria bacterium]|nr:hypothetical protein [Candidatus Eisenbacteria bacterium]
MTGPLVKTTAAKAWISAIGSTITALTTFYAAVQVATADNGLDAGDVSSLLVAGVALVGTVYGVWRTPNKPAS